MIIVPLEHSPDRVFGHSVIVVSGLAIDKSSAELQRLVKENDSRAGIGVR